MESQRSDLQLFGSGTKSCLISVHQGYLPLLSQVVEDRLTERPLFFDRFVLPNLILHFCHMFLSGLRYVPLRALRSLPPSPGMLILMFSLFVLLVGFDHRKPWFDLLCQFGQTWSLESFNGSY